MDRVNHRIEGADPAPDSPLLVLRVLRDLAEGRDVLLIVSPSCGETVLDYAAARLEGQRNRVVRLSGDVLGGLGLPAFLKQLRAHAGRLGSAAGLAGPERDIAVLTTTDPSCDRIVLLIDSADALDRGVLLAIQLACQASKQLRLVFAGRPALVSLLEDPELAVLRERLHHHRGLVAVPGVARPEVVEVARTGRVAVRRHTRGGVLSLAAACAVMIGSLGIVATSVMGPRLATDAPLPQVASVPAAPLPKSESVAGAEPEVKAAGAPETAGPVIAGPETAGSETAGSGIAGSGTAIEPKTETVAVPAMTVAPPAADGLDPAAVRKARPVTTPLPPPQHRGPVQMAQHVGRRGTAGREVGLSRTADGRLAAWPVEPSRADYPPSERFLPEYAEPPRSAPPGSFADSDPYGGGYIGTFSPGPGGVRSFQYRP